MIIIDVVPNNIKKLRWRLKLTLKDMESKTGISGGAISKIENGKSTPNQDTIKAICKGMGLPSSMVFDLDDLWVKL